MGNSSSANEASEGETRRLGKYELLGEVARGGQGVVYRALDPDSGREVAVKTLISASSEAHRRRFLREVDALSRLRHPGVVTIFDAGEERGRLWYSMPLLEGQSLEELVEREPLGAEEVIRVGRALCAALGAVHEGGCIHRDVKPANVLLCEGRPMLVDFGLTKDLEVEETLALSRTGAALGTPGYWSPEQAAGKPAGIPTDIYGLGATLYAALTGRPPIEGGSFVEVVVATRQRAPDPPSSLRDDVPGALEDVILRCLAKDPGERYPDAASVLQALQGAEEADVRSRTPAAFVFGGALLLLLAASLALAFGPQGPVEGSLEQSELAQALVAALSADATDFLPDPGLMLRCQPLLGADGLPRTDVPPDLARALTRYRFEIATLRGESTEPMLERLRALDSPAAPLLTCRATRASGGSTDDETLASLKRLAGGSSPLAAAALPLLVKVLGERDPAAADLWAQRIEEPGRRRALQDLELWRLLHAHRQSALRGYLDQAGDSAQHLLPRALRWEEARILACAASSPIRFGELVVGLRVLGTLRHAAHAPRARNPLTEVVLAAIVGHESSPSFSGESMLQVLRVLKALGATGLRLADPRGAGTKLLELLAQRTMVGASEPENWGQVLWTYLRLDGELGLGHLNRVPKPTDSNPLDRALFLRVQILYGAGRDRDQRFSAELRSLLRTGKRCPGLGPVNRAACLLAGLKGCPPRERSEIVAEALRLDPESPWAHLQAGMLAWREGESRAILSSAEAAISAYERGRYLDRGSVWRSSAYTFYRGLMSLYGYCGARERAEELLDSLAPSLDLDVDQLRECFQDARLAGQPGR
jgi:hypothetical protein